MIHNESINNTGVRVANKFLHWKLGKAIVAIRYLRHWFHRNTHTCLHVSC